MIRISDTALAVPLVSTIRILFAGILLVSTQVIAQDTIAPPSIGQETKGTPAIIEPKNEQAVAGSSKKTVIDQPEYSILGNAKVTELRRESGQVYLIELEHSSGSKQYIEENDSDGKIESTSNDIEETPNLPKWRLGSW